MSFVVWIGLGVVLARMQPLLRRKSSRFSRNVKILLAAGLMVTCLAFLFVPLDIILNSGGFKGGEMSLPIWLVVTACGLMFVGANSVSMGLLVAVAKEGTVTERSRPASSKQDFD